jgi:transcription antitermination protein NusB
MSRSHATPAKQARSVARLAAVQALYQMEVAGAGVEAVLREFADHRFGSPVETDDAAASGSAAVDHLADADEVFFADIVRGVVTHQADIDRAVSRRLAANWRLERLDATLRATLRSATYELMHRSDVPTEVVLDEYVELAKAFFAKTDAGFVNGALDAVARDLRP